MTVEIAQPRSAGPKPIMGLPADCQHHAQRDAIRRSCQDNFKPRRANEILTSLSVVSPRGAQCSADQVIGSIDEHRARLGFAPIRDRAVLVVLFSSRSVSEQSLTIVRAGRRA